MKPDELLALLAIGSPISAKYLLKCSETLSASSTTASPIIILGKKEASDDLEFEVTVLVNFHSSQELFFWFF